MTIGVKEACSISRILWPLNILMLLEGGRERGRTVRWSKWIKDTSINKTSLRATTPKTIHGNVQASPLLSIRSGKMEVLRVVDRLKFWFSTNLGTHFS